MRYLVLSVTLSTLFAFTVPPTSASPDVQWLGRWDKRAKITINGTNINEPLTNFPVLIHLSTNSGENAEDVSFVFDELETDANRKKIAVTTSNGTNQCYVEIEEWDHTNRQAWLWARVPNVASNADTDLYLYYDRNQPDNTNWVGNPDSTPAENVWDSNYKFVCHMQDDPDTNHVRDSTSNSKDGTKAFPGKPAETTGKIGKGQNFIAANSNYYFTCTNKVFDVNQTNFTVQFWMNTSTSQSTRGMVCRYGSTISYIWFGLNANRAWMECKVAITNVPVFSLTGARTLNDGAWHLVTFARNYGATNYIYVDSLADTNGTNQSFSGEPGNVTLHVGIRGPATLDNAYNGLMDELRISSVACSLAWVKASYETQRDHLVDFGIEEKRRKGTIIAIE